MLARAWQPTRTGPLPNHELPAAHDTHAPAAAAQHPALHPLPAQPGRILGQPQRLPDGAPPMVPVLLPGPRPGQPSHQAVRSSIPSIARTTLEQARRGAPGARPLSPPQPGHVAPGPRLATPGRPTHRQGGCEGEAHQRRHLCLSRTPAEPNASHLTSRTSRGQQPGRASPPAGSPTTVFPSRQPGHPTRSRAPDQVYLRAALNAVG